MSNLPRRQFLKNAALSVLLASASGSMGFAETPAKDRDTHSWDSIVKQHPAKDALKKLFPKTPAAPPSHYTPTGMSRADYLPVMAGVVDFFRGFQDWDGAIIDPYAHVEHQYSTPAFAAAAALLVKEAGRDDLIEPASHALTCSIRALANHKTADGHADFYIPMVIHARRSLMGKVAASLSDEWTCLILPLVPENTYSDTVGRLNWNLVNVAGECLRRHDGLVASELQDAQMAYIERSLVKHEHAMTQFGMYQDPNSPLSYDAFPRLWIEEVLADGAYHGNRYDQWRDFLTLGGLSTLLLVSPSGEWPCGGRSAHHQWNEAQIAAICEINAARWKALGRLDVAGAFKRAAHLALTSIRHWRRPSGELWIVKNHADPALRHGYEGYSYHSQYNLLPMAMLAIAYTRADDTIIEAPTCSEYGSYVFDLRDIFHKVCACAGGTYALIDTAADPHYNATGLLRVHKSGVALSAFSDNTTKDCAYGPVTASDHVGISPGLAWKTSNQDTEWLSLADFVNPSYADPKQTRTVEKTKLEAVHENPGRVTFTIDYSLKGVGARSVAEDYTISGDGVEVTSRLGKAKEAVSTRLTVPILVSNGADDLPVTVKDGSIAIDLAGSLTTWQLHTPSNMTLSLEGPRVPSHNGWVRAASAALPAGTQTVRWSVRFGSPSVV